jgi:3-oxoacyl-[acyl-carrier-protein] synthase II
VKPLAITGLGVVSSLGIGWEAFRDAYARAAEGSFSERPETVPRDPSPALRVAEVAGFDAKKYVGDKGLRANDRLTKLSLVAARLGLEHAGLKRDGAFTGPGADEVGVVASTAYGSTEAIAENNRIAKLEDPRYLNPARFPNTVINSASGNVSIWEDLQGLNATVTNGPTGGLDAFGCADTLLATGRARALLVGGAEALSESLCLGMARTDALDRDDPPPGALAARRARACGWAKALRCCASKTSRRPAQRGATVWAVVSGYGTANVAPDDDDAPLVRPSAEALALAIEDALRDARPRSRRGRRGVEWPVGAPRARCVRAGRDRRRARYPGAGGGPEGAAGRDARRRGRVGCRDGGGAVAG